MSAGVRRIRQKRTRAKKKNALELKNLSSADVDIMIRASCEKRTTPIESGRVDKPSTWEVRRSPRLPANQSRALITQVELQQDLGNERGAYLINNLLKVFGSTCLVNS